MKQSTGHLVVAAIFAFAAALNFVTEDNSRWDKWRLIFEGIGALVFLVLAVRSRHSEPG